MNNAPRDVPCVRGCEPSNDTRDMDRIEIDCGAPYGVAFIRVKAPGETALTVIP
jgi:hypothetical protein